MGRFYIECNALGPSPVPELSFFPAQYIGAEPGRAKRESRITCFVFYHNNNVKENFFFRARAEKAIARHIDVCSVAWTLVDNGLVIFDWFVLSMRMQVILDSLFARPGSTPIWGGKEGEFRDWTVWDYWMMARPSSNRD